jgi:hypothetical protein
VSDQEVGNICQDRVRYYKIGQDRTRQDKTRQDKTKQDKTRQDKTRQDKTRQDKTRQDKTRQDKTRQDRMHSLLKSLSVNMASLATMRAGPWRGDIEASRRDTEGWVFSSSIIITFVAPNHQGG